MAGKMEDLRTRTDDQLDRSVTDLKREQMNLRFQAATGQLQGKAPSRIREVRREIARIKTLRTQRSAAEKS